MQAGGPGAEVQVHPPARVGIAKLGLGLQHVLAAQVDGRAPGEFAAAVHQHLGMAARCAVGAKGPARYRKHALCIRVDVLIEVRQRLGANVFGRGLNGIPSCKVAPHGLVQCLQGVETGAQKVPEACAGRRAVVSDAVGAAKAHALLKVWKVVVYLAQQRDCPDLAAVVGLQCAQGVHHGCSGLSAPQVDRGLAVCNVPVIHRLAVIRASGHGAFPGLGQVARVCRQGLLQGGVRCEMGRKQVHHHRPLAVAHSAGQLVDPCGINLPVVALFFEELQQRHRH